MVKAAARFEIKTLGCFSITRDGIPVATDWPDEMGKALFCSLLSPLDLYSTWDRISRSILNEPETQVSRRHLKDIIRPLKSFLIHELGFNPLITVDENMRIDLQFMDVDAFEFYDSALEGLKLLPCGCYAAAMQKFRRARTLYSGIYLPEMEGTIIANTRAQLESLYRQIVAEDTRQVAVNPLKPLTWHKGL